MKVAFIGASGHWKYAVNGIKTEDELQICGVSPGSKGEDISPLVHELHKDGYAPPIFDDYTKMLNEQRPDVVVVDNFFSDHAHVGIAALKRGAHLFIEKPIATTLKDLEALYRAYEESGCHLAAMHGLRYAPAFYTAWSVIRSGDIGKPRLIHTQKSYRLGSRPPFFKHRHSYGGTIPWVGSHAIDWIYWFSTKRFRSVFASHSRQGNQDHGELETTALCHFTMEDGVFASASIDYLRPETAPSHGDDRIRVAGTKGVVEVQNGDVHVINGLEGVRKLEPKDPGNIFQDFLQHIRGHKECLIGAEDSFYVTEICLRARQSADENRVVELSR